MSSVGPSKPPRPSRRRWRLFRVAIPLWRLAVLVAAFFCVHQAHLLRTEKAERKLDGAWISEVRRWLPAADHFGEPQVDDRLAPVLDDDDELTGWTTQTFPEAGEVTGYAGASNLLVMFDKDRRVLGSVLLSSEDTAGHLARIEKDNGFFSQWNGRHAASLGALDEADVVSGATLTSDAITRGLAARFGAKDAAEWFPDELSLEQVRSIFPQAAGFESADPGVYRVAGGNTDQMILRSSLAGVAVRGFQGPSDLLVGLDGDVIAGVRLLGSRDNEPYILDAADELRFADPFAGQSANALLANGSEKPFVVSGASYTARSIEQSVHEMLRRHHQPAPENRIDWRSMAGLAWVVAGLIIGLSRLRGHRRLRLGFAVVSMVGGGLWLGWMVAQDQWITWAKRGSFSGTGWAMLALSASAILVPAIFGKNVYCSHICPHGAAQTLLGATRRRRFALPQKLHRIFKSVPWVGLVALWLLALMGSSFSASYAEPFEIWSAGFFALMPTLIFGVGLVSAAFLPQAYCHYGCPTGALLTFLTHSPSHWTRRDSIAVLLVGGAWVFVFIS